MTIRRREFIGMAGATLAAAGSPLAGAEPLPHAMSHPLSEIGSAPASAAAADAAAWDMTWVDRITGKHRAVFDSPDVSDGAALFRAVMWCNQYKEIYQTPRTDMSPVVVIRHTGIVMAMKTEFWDRYDPAKEFKLEDDDGKPVRRNPIAGPAEGAENKSPYNIPAFVASGGIVLGCALAFSGIVASVRKKDKLNREEADAAARALLLPGVILMPSGIFAVLRSQEAGCHYILGS